MSATGATLQRLRDRILAARDSKTALEIRGGCTKRFYGNPPRGEPLEVRELAGVTSYEPTELVVTVLAGTPLAELESVLAERGQCLPFEPPRFGAMGTVGGMVAAGLSGPARACVGPLRDFVLGVTMLNGAGERLTFGGQVMKNVAGYDVSRVIAGSMGILGVICEVSLKVMPILPACRTLCFEMDETAALKQLNRWAGESFPMNASAWHMGRLYLRLAGAKAAVGHALESAGGRELEPPAAAAWWSDIRDHRHEFFSLSDAQLERGECSWRLAVPDSAPPITLPGEQFIEWGGGQRWWRSAAPASQIRSAAERAGGHATLVRAADKSPGVFTTLKAASMNIHRRLKQSFDPAGIFNPGRLYAEL
ncbi:MAG: glycolate oxidase binding subunit [Gammaproteobacteria bacterium]|jgi:glycolate oxidase FAD binding subunit|nr:glycolate oxidase binding subunit [Gammaproteobacteria bacterium]